jgi:hypothetical protein
LQCAQCHDHLFISDYKQADFQGLYAFAQNVSLGGASPPSVNDRPPTKKVAFASVFEKVQKETGPRLIGMKEVPFVALKSGTLARLADEMTDANNRAFARNFANRLCYLMVGRGLVHPLDLHHSENPPSHPEVLDLLAQDAVLRKYDIKALLRELALSETYQRSSVLPPGVHKPEPTSFLTAHEKRLSAKELLASVLEATGEKARLEKSKPALDALRAKFLKAFANPAREPEEEFTPALRSALFHTWFRALGIDVRKARYNNNGQPLPIAHEDCKAIKELLA